MLASLIDNRGGGAALWKGRPSRQGSSWVFLVCCVSSFTTSRSYATQLRMQVVKYRVGHYYQYVSKALG
jgi:hypothetical protein